VSKKVRIINLTRERVLLEEAEVAGTFFRRLKGLLGRGGLPEGRGMLIKPCRAVHTVAMSFPIDVAFVDGENRICFLLESLPPFRFSPAVREASCVIEAPAGTFRQHQACEGDLLKVVEL
jgi:uncharacterized membrane protein (UPF0127 family)